MDRIARQSKAMRFFILEQLRLSTSGPLACFYCNRPRLNLHYYFSPFLGLGEGSYENESNMVKYAYHGTSIADIYKILAQPPLG